MSWSLACQMLTVSLLLLPMGQPGVYGRKIYAYFDTLECHDFDTKYLESMNCWLQPDQQRQLMMNVEFVLAQNLTSLISKFRFIIEQNIKNMTYLSMDIDVCATLGAALRNPILRLVAEEMRRKSNYPLGCPLKKGFKYALYNFTINNKLIPPFAPRMRWISDSNFWTNTSGTMEHFLHYINSGRVEHTKPKRPATV